MKKLDLSVGAIHYDDSRRTARLVLPSSWIQAVMDLVPEPFASNQISEPSNGPKVGRTVRSIAAYPSWEVVAVLCYGPESLAHPDSCKVLNRDYVRGGCRPAFSGLVLDVPYAPPAPNPLDGYLGEYDQRLIPLLKDLIPLNLICALDSVMTQWPKGADPVKWGYMLRIGKRRLRRLFDKPEACFTDQGLKGGIEADQEALEALIRN